MPLIHTTPPHLQSPSQVSHLMLTVLYALLPGIAVSIGCFGWGVVFQLWIACCTALLAEAVMLWVRGLPLKLFLTDGSALVTAVLLAISLPPLLPWLLTVLGTAFAIVVAKHLYGGLGQNPFNPAMVGYALLLLAYPKYMTQWVDVMPVSGFYPSFVESFNVIFGLGGQDVGLRDHFTGATVLDSVKAGLAQGVTMGELGTLPQFGLFGGIGWEWVNVAYLLGGLWLLRQRVIAWHIPVGFLGSLSLLAGVFYFYHSALYLSPLVHLFSGATMLAAFFIATDPVSAATSPLGRLIYAMGIGCFVFIIRTFGGYPDGVAFAVLLMNIAAPMLDYYTQPRPFGQSY